MLPSGSREHADVADRRRHLGRRHGQAALGPGPVGDLVERSTARQLDAEVGERRQDLLGRVLEGVGLGEELRDDQDERAVGRVGVAEPGAVADVVVATVEQFERGVGRVPVDRRVDVAAPAGRCGSSAASVGRRSWIAHSFVHPSGISGSSPPLTHSTNVLPHGSSKACVEPVELRPVVVTPQHGRAQALGGVEDAVRSSRRRSPGSTSAIGRPSRDRCGARRRPGRDGGVRWRRCRCPCGGCPSAPASRRRAGSSAAGTMRWNTPSGRPSTSQPNTSA